MLNYKRNHSGWIGRTVYWPPPRSGHTCSWRAGYGRMARWW